MYAPTPETARFARELAAGHDGPFYLYDVAELRRICAAFLAIPYDNLAVHFATMANESPEFLRHVRDAGLNVFVNSPGHLARVQQLGFAGEQIVFTASAMDEATMRQVHAAGALLNLDSLGQAAQWQRLFPGAPAGLRCNIGERITPRASRAGFFLGRESRLGLTLDELDQLAGAPWVAGLHLYVGTDLLELDHFAECYAELARLARRFPALRYLDFGGGFGVPREESGPFDFAGYGALVQRVMGELSTSLGRSVRLILEPGRIVGAQSGHFVCRVVDVKWRDGRQLIGVNASSAQFPRPLFYPDSSFHPATVIAAAHPGAAPAADPILVSAAPTPLPGAAPAAAPAAAPCSSDVYGCSTYSRDYLARQVLLPAATPGDLVLFAHAGAYCASAHTAFLGFPQPAEFYR